MIQLATERLLIADEMGQPCPLDLAELETNLIQAFRNLGFKDGWMAEELSLTIEEKIRGTESRLLSRSEIDSMVVSVLNASGFADVGREYLRLLGGDPYGEARKAMRSWTEGEIRNLLCKSLPITDLQLSKLSDACWAACAQLKLSQVSEKFLFELALHLLLNGTAEVPEEQRGTDWRERLSTQAQEALSQGILKILPCTSILPRARVGISVRRLASLYSDWWMPMGLNSVFPPLLETACEILGGVRQELIQKHPMLSDSPAHILVQELSESMASEPNLWRRRERLELQHILEHLLEAVAKRATNFSVVCSIKN